VEEAKTTVALSHPNIVPVYELGLEQGTYFLAMELVEGCSIAELVRERNLDPTSTRTKRVLSPEEGAYVGMEVCRALDYAHRRMNVVHRDITPRNVMLDEEGQVKLIDFGIAAPALVAGHEILGSPGHMPPEQVEGKELGPPTDIFAVAVLLMEAWSGVAPFRRATPELCNDAMREKHPKPSDYNPRLIPLDDVIVRAMQLDPKKRQQDAADVARALRAFLQGTDVTDIARELGDRVRDLREAASEPMPMSLDGKTRAPNPSVGDLGTKTFAAREEAVRWSSPPASEIEPPGASTRRLQESIPPPSELPSIGATPVALSKPPPPQTPMGETPVARARPDPAMSIPTPLMVEPVGLGGDVLLRNARAAQEAALASHASGRTSPAERVDTLATRPLETAVRGKNDARPGTSSSRSRVVSLVILAGVVVIGGGMAWRARSANERTEGGPAPTMSTSIASTASVTATTSSATTPPSTTKPAISASPPASGALGVVNPGGVATSHPAPPTSASNAEKPGRTMVAFLGDPGTHVSIDGTMRGACPVRVNLEPGQHDVRFTFDPTGESRGERISVKAGEKITVRAEFTGATPTVRIQR
jgi:serine/threonine protein kinase